MVSFVGFVLNLVISMDCDLDDWGQSFKSVPINYIVLIHFSEKKRICGKVQAKIHNIVQSLKSCKL